MGSVESVDYGADLTAGWDDIDAEIQRATPGNDDALKGYTGELRGLDEIGLQPFSIEGVDDPEGDAAEGEDVVEFEDAYETDLSFLNEAPSTARGQSAGRRGDVAGCRPDRRLGHDR